MEIEKLIPECKDYLWGGTRLIEKYGKKTDKRPVAETWELSLHKDGMSRLSDGTLLSDALDADALGDNVKDFEFFPMLIKFIDACDNLSVQVHPSDEYALKNEDSYGKTEMWYIVDADEGAGIYLGFSRDVTEDEVRLAIENDTILSLLNFFPVKKGESYFIPSGTIHAIGAGCLICEIQQNSNLTYRVYDYGRKDKNGNTRELHINKALRVLDFGKYERKIAEGALLGISKYFTVSKHIINKQTCFSLDEKTFKCLSVVSGEGYINETALNAGDSYFIPATEKSITLDGNMEVILSEVRKYSLSVEENEGTYTVTLKNDVGACISSMNGDNLNNLKSEILSGLYISESDLI